MLYNLNKLIENPEKILENPQGIFKEMATCSQNNPHHYGHVLRHTIDAIQFIKSAEPGNFELIIAALLHDCGKPSVKAVNPKTGFDCFYNHETKSAELAKSILEKEGYHRHIIRHICNVVKHHDLSMHMTTNPASANKYCLLVTPENIQKRIDDWQISYEEFQDILKLCTADVMAQSEIADMGFCKTTRQEKLEVISAIIKNSKNLKFY